MRAILLFLLFSNWYIYTQDYNQVKKVVAFDRESNNYFGSSPKVYGNLAAVGCADDTDENGSNHIEATGAVYLFQRSFGGEWIEKQKLVASDRQLAAYFGGSIDISENYIVIGANQNITDENNQSPINNAGAAYIFKKDDNGFWQETQKIVASNRVQYDRFGSRVAIDDSTIIVSAPSKNNQSGAVYLFKLNNAGVWLEQQILTSLDLAIGDNFGNSIAISNNFIAIGAVNEDEDEQGNNTMLNEGSAYVFNKQSNGNWIQYAKLVASDRMGYQARFGFSVDVDSNFIIVGADSEYFDENGQNLVPGAGAAYMFTLDLNGNWMESQKILPSDRSLGDIFGSSVALSNNKLLISAHLEEDGPDPLLDDGSAYVFYWDEITSKWIEHQKVKANDGNSQDHFGSSGVSIYNDYIFIGARHDDEDEIGTNPLQDAGSAYIFELKPVLSIPETKKLDIIIFPNPARNYFKIKTPLTGECNVRILDLLGRTVFYEPLKNDKIVNIMNLKSGQYIVEIQLNNKITYSKIEVLK
ncbi:MAG: T9SS type A sorting domain-containing protein [Crocinitomicaceae bacterium]